MEEYQKKTLDLNEKVLAHNNQREELEDTVKKNSESISDKKKAIEKLKYNLQQQEFKLRQMQRDAEKQNEDMVEKETLLK